jgi:DNA primase
MPDDELIHEQREKAFEQIQMEYFESCLTRGMSLDDVKKEAENYYKKSKAFAHALAERLEQEHPEQVVSRMQKAVRKGKVLIDWSKNDQHKTTVNVFPSERKSDRRSPLRSPGRK